MGFKRTAILAYRCLKRFTDHGDSQLAASISYYVLLSLFPLLIFSVGVLGIFLEDKKLQQDLVNTILDNIPFSQDQGRDDVAQALRDVAGARGTGVGLIGLLTMAWSSSAMFGTIRRSLNVAFEVENPRPALRQKAIDLVMVLAFAPFFLGSIVASTALRLAQEASGDVPVVGSLPHVLGAGWLLISILLPMVASFLAFFLLYAVIPPVRRSHRDLAVGALLAAALFELAKLVFTIYLVNFSNYSFVFGSLGAVVAFLFWVFLSASVLLLGAEVAAVLPAVRRGEYDYDLGGRPGAPKRSLAQKAGAFLHSLVFSRKSDSSAP